MEILWIAGGLGSIASAIYLVKGILERRKCKNLIYMLKSGRISEIEEILKNIKNPEHTTGFYSRKNKNQFTALISGNLCLSRNRMPIKVSEEGLNLTLLTMVKNQFFLFSIERKNFSFWEKQ